MEVERDGGGRGKGKRGAREGIQSNRKTQSRVNARVTGGESEREGELI